MRIFFFQIVEKCGHQNFERHYLYSFSILKYIYLIFHWFIMQNRIQRIREIFSKKAGTDISEKLFMIAQDYKILLISANLSLDQKNQISQDLQKSKIIVIDHYEERPDLYFIISFHKTIILINQSYLLFFYQHISSKSELELSFLTEKKDVFDQIIKFKYKEKKINDQNQFDEEISNFCKGLFIPKSHIPNCIDLWGKISKCMSKLLSNFSNKNEQFKLK